MDNTQKRLKQTKIQLKQQEGKRKNYEIKLLSQKKLLIAQIKAMYRMGHQPFLKIILNQENPEQLNRYIYYYECLYRARWAIIQQYQNLSDKVRQTTDQVEHQANLLKKIQYQQYDEKKILAHEKQQRKIHLLKTEKTIQTAAQQLEKLRKDKERLEQIIHDVQSAQPSEIEKEEPPLFVQNRWANPVGRQGKIIQYFGQSLIGGRFHSSGVVIAAPLGTPIHAVSSGKVVFADWLRGFGLIIIVQHSRSYMSIYARNQSIFVKVGQPIQSGEILATVGNSGGFNQSALYFEVRHFEKPINPAPWLKRQHVL